MHNLDGQSIATDKEGYLKNTHDWHEGIVPLLAEQEGIILSPEHWEIIYFIRQFYQEFNTSPSVRLLVKAVAEKFGKEKGNSQYLFTLFPKGPAKQATKLAGLPKPAKCL